MYSHFRQQIFYVYQSGSSTQSEAQEQSSSEGGWARQGTSSLNTETIKILLYLSVNNVIDILY